MFRFADDPTLIKLVGEPSSFWDSPAFASIVTLLAALLGGFAAFLIARYQTNAARDADDRRQWGVRALDLFHEISIKSEPLHEVWSINNGDIHKLGKTEVRSAQALREVELAYTTLSIILPKDLPELEEVMKVCRRIQELVENRDDGEVRPTERMEIAYSLPDKIESLRKAIRPQIGIKN